MPLTVALNSMTHLESKGIPPEVSKQLKQDVMEGRSLSDAMAKQPVIFTEMYINMVRAGEASGATGNGSPAAPAPVPSGVAPQGPAHGAEHADAADAGYLRQALRE